MEQLYSVENGSENCRTAFRMTSENVLLLQAGWLSTYILTQEYMLLWYLHTHMISRGCGVMATAVVSCTWLGVRFTAILMKKTRLFVLKFHTGSTFVCESRISII